MNEEVERVKQHINEKYNEISDLPAIAIAVQCNYNTVRAEFARLCGMTIGCYLKSVRCNQAAELLKNTDAKLYAIAVEVGFHNEKYFMKVFKKVIGFCPTEFRNGNGNIKQ